MMKNLAAKLAPIDTEREVLAKQIGELQEKYEALDAKKTLLLQDCLQTISDDECQHIEDCLFRLFKIYYANEKALVRVKRNRFSVISSLWDEGRITFTVGIKGVGEYNISEHPAVFDDIEKYIILRTNAVKSQKTRTKMREKNTLAEQKVSDFLDGLLSIG